MKNGTCIRLSFCVIYLVIWGVGIRSTNHTLSLSATTTCGLLSGRAPSLAGGGARLITDSLVAFPEPTIQASASFVFIRHCQRARKKLQDKTKSGTPEGQRREQRTGSTRGEHSQKRAMYQSPAQLRKQKQQPSRGVPFVKIGLLKRTVKSTQKTRL
jgi:hypothetical protein